MWSQEAIGICVAATELSESNRSDVYGRRLKAQLEAGE